MQAANWGQNLQAGARGAADSFNRFVEGEDARPQRSRAEPERREFWDDFSSLALQEQANASAGHQRSGSHSGAIGTAAMRKGPATSSLANTSTPGTADSTVPSGVEAGEVGVASSTATKGKEDWDENW